MPIDCTLSIPNSDEVEGQMEMMEAGIKRARTAAEASRKKALAERTAREALEREQRHAEVARTILPSLPPPPPLPIVPHPPRRSPLCWAE